MDKYVTKPSLIWINAVNKATAIMAGNKRTTNWLGLPLAEPLFNYLLDLPCIYRLFVESVARKLYPNTGRFQRRPTKPLISISHPDYCERSHIMSIPPFYFEIERADLIPVCETLNNLVPRLRHNGKSKRVWTYACEGIIRARPGSRF